MLYEPFSYIVPLFIEKIKQLINDEKQRKIIIMTDHLYRNVIEMSDTIYLLRNGCTTQIDDLKMLEAYQYLNTGALE